MSALEFVAAAMPILGLVMLCIYTLVGFVVVNRWLLGRSR